MTNAHQASSYLPTLPTRTPPRQSYQPPKNLPPAHRRELRPMDATLESYKTRENKRQAVMKNHFESKQLLSFTKHLDTMKAVYHEKMKRDKLRVGKSLWELEQRKRKIMRQIYNHTCTDVGRTANPTLFYFTNEKPRRKARHHGTREKTKLPVIALEKETVGNTGGNVEQLGSARLVPAMSGKEPWVERDLTRLEKKNRPVTQCVHWGRLQTC